MKRSLSMALLIAVATTTTAAPKSQTETQASTPMSYTTWDPGCEHTMTTNHFDLAPGQSVEIPLDLSLCYPEQLGSLLFWGYSTAKTHSRPLSQRNNIRLTVTDEGAGETMGSNDGSVLVEAGNTTYTLRAENMNHNQTLTIRLRSQSGL